MPCDTVTTTTVAMQKMDMTLLAAGLRAAGHVVREVNNGLSFAHGGYTQRYENGKLIATGVDAQELSAKMAVAYSTEIVKAQAKKFGWQMKEVAPQKWQVIRR